MFIHVHFDVNGLSSLDRRYFVYIRRLSHELLSWFCSTYEVTSTTIGRTVDTMKELVLPYLAHMADGILAYKAQWSDDGVPGATLAEVEMQMSACLRLFPLVDRKLYRQQDSFPHFAWPWDRNVTCVKRSEPLPRGIALCYSL